MPRRRNFVRFLIVGLLLLAAWVAFEATRLHNTDPVVTVDYGSVIRTRAIAMSAVDPDAGLDAWKALQRAFDVYDAINAEIIERETAGGYTPRGAWDVGVIDYTIILADPAIPAVADRELSALQLFDERGGADELAAFARASTAMRPADVLQPGQPIPNLIEQAMFPELARAKKLATALAARMRVAHEDDDPARVLASFDQLLAIARTMTYQPGLIGLLVGQAIQALAIDELNRELVEGSFSEILCRRLIDTLDRRKLAPTELAIEAERSVFHDMVQQVFTDDGNGDGLLAQTNLMSAAIARFLGPRRASVVAVADDYFDGYVASARQTVDQRATQGFDRKAFITGLGFSPSNRFARRLLPDLDRAFPGFDMTRSRVESARLLLAIEIHQERHGAPPSKLDDLIPAILPRLPVDPLHGGPFGYRRLDDDATKNGFVLYSYGLDALDNGGAISPRGAFAAYGEDGAGFDVVINTPRPRWYTGE